MRLWPLLLCLLAACSPPPDLPDTFAKTPTSDAFPTLRPIEPLAPVDEENPVEASLRAEAAALDARADDLRAQEP